MQPMRVMSDHQTNLIKMQQVQKKKSAFISPKTGESLPINNPGIVMIKRWGLITMITTGSV